MSKKIVLIIVSLVVAAVCAGFVVAMVTVNSNDPTVDYDDSKVTTMPDVGPILPIVQLDGSWVVARNGTTMTAVVSNNVITITMSKDDSSMVYWNGTFQSTASVGETVTSTKIETDSIVLSGADTKNFQIASDTLTFDMSAMGVTTSVQARRA
jgi:hypothetical protein